jgi:WD40 repeat protein
MLNEASKDNQQSGVCKYSLRGHSGRIWDVASNPTGQFIGSASGDSTIRVNAPSCRLLKLSTDMEHG